MIDNANKDDDSNHRMRARVSGRVSRDIKAPLTLGPVTIVPNV